MKRLKYIKYLLLISTCFFIVSNVFGQRKFEKIHQLKINFISDRIDLTNTQANQFWPIYNNYEDDLLEIRKGFFKEYRRQNTDRTEEEARKSIEDNLDYQEALINLKRKYNDQFLKVISAKQLSELYAAEREFKQMLIQKLRERRNRG